jgi:hypothetical protein
MSVVEFVLVQHVGHHKMDQRRRCDSGLMTHIGRQRDLSLVRIVLARQTAETLARAAASAPAATFF